MNEAKQRVRETLAVQGFGVLSPAQDPGRLHPNPGAHQDREIDMPGPELTELAAEVVARLTAALEAV